MRYSLAIFLLLCSVGCEKSLDPETCCTTYYPTHVPPALPWNVINDIVLCCDNNGSLSWVGDHFYEFQFNKEGPGYGLYGVNIADYWTGLFYGQPDTVRRFYFKYVGPLPLFDTSRIIGRNEWVINYTVPKSYLHKPLFEARDKNNDSLFQTFLFGDSGSTVAVAYFFNKNVDIDPTCGWTCGTVPVPAPPGPELTNDTLTKLFNIYLAPDSLHKLNVHWGNDGSF